MTPEQFYQQIARIATLSPYDRYARLGKFHTEVTMRYLAAIRNITAEESVETVDSGLTLGQVVASVAEWERYTILAGGEIVSGVRRPKIMQLQGYLDTSGETRSFDTIDAFNAYQLEKYSQVEWIPIKDLAIHTATALHTLFTQPALLSPDTLQRTDRYEWILPTGLKLTLPIGWYLWMSSIQREAVDHADTFGWLLH